MASSKQGDEGTAGVVAIGKASSGEKSLLLAMLGPTYRTEGFHIKELTV